MSLAHHAPRLAVVALVGLVVSCDAPAWDRGLLLEEAAALVIVPGYDALASRALELDEAVTSLCAAPDVPRLAAASSAWEATFAAFEETLAYRIGPARDMNLADEMGFWPVSPLGIERIATGTDPIDAHAIDALGAGSKGLLAMAYLLWGGSADPTWRPSTDPATIVVALGAARRCELLAAYADHVVRTSHALATAWHADGGGYATALATAGSAGNTVWPDQGAAVAELFTAMLDALKLTKNVELGIPIGHRSTMASPSSVHSPFAPASVDAMRAHVRGVSRLWSGPSDHDLDHWLRARDPDLGATVRGELAAATAGLEALGAITDADPADGTFVDYCAGTDHAVGETAYTRVDAAETTLATEVAARLGLGIAFSDMDGD